MQLHLSGAGAGQAHGRSGERILSQLCGEETCRASRFSGAVAKRVARLTHRTDWTDGQVRPVGPAAECPHFEFERSDQKIEASNLVGGALKPGVLMYFIFFTSQKPFH